MRILIITLLCFLSNFAFSYDYEYKDSRGRYHPSKVDLADPVQRQFWEKSMRNNDYYSSETHYKRVRFGLENGVKSKNTLPATIENQVSKKAVSSKIFSKMKLGPRVFGKVFGGSAMLAYDAWLALKGWYFDEKEKNYGKPLGDFYYVVASDESSSWGVRNDIYYSKEAIHKSYNTGSFSTPYEIIGKIDTPAELFDMVCSDVTFWYENKNVPADSMHAGKCRHSLSNTVSGKTHQIFLSSGFRALSQTEFDNIMIPEQFDNDPSTAVNASKNSENETVGSPVGKLIFADGATFTTDPYTDPEDGKAKQFSAKFSSSTGEFTGTTTFRPDLDGNEDLAPKPKPDTGTGTGTGNGNGGTNPTEMTVPLQCDDEKYPNSLGCIDTSEDFDKDASDIELPTEEIPLDFEVKNHLKDESGICPAPIRFSFNLFGNHNHEVSFQPLCDFASGVRPAVILAGFIMAFYILGARRK